MSTVRLSFPQGEHRDVLVGNGETTIGAGASSTVVLPQAGVRELHASILVDQRGYTLRVHGPDARVHVNARPVREIAILRLGDVVSLGNVSFVLKPDSDDMVATGEPVPVNTDTPPPPGTPAASGADTRYRVQPPKVVLRGVSGPYFGRVVPVHGRLTIGRGSECDLVLDEPEMSRKHATIEVGSGEIWLRDLGSANGTYVNGVQVRDTYLYGGDQIAFDRNRFLLEAPGMPVRRATPGPRAAEPQRPNVTAVMPAIRFEGDADRASQPQPPPVDANGGWSPWWLLAAAALIGIGIAVLFIGLR